LFCRQCGAGNADTGKFCRKCGTQLSQPKEIVEPTNVQPPAGEASTVPQSKPSVETATSSSSKIAGVFCYMFGWISGILFLLLNRKDYFVRFHAWQSIITFIILSILFVLIYNVAIWLLTVFLWLFLMYKASQGKITQLPIIGNLAQKWSRK